MLSALSEEPSCDSWLSLFKTGLKEANRLNLAPIAVARSRTESGNMI